MGFLSRRLLPEMREWPHRIGLILDEAEGENCLALHKADYMRYRELQNQRGPVAKVATACLVARVGCQASSSVLGSDVSLLRNVAQLSASSACGLRTRPIATLVEAMLEFVTDVWGFVISQSCRALCAKHRAKRSSSPPSQLACLQHASREAMKLRSCFNSGPNKHLLRILELESWTRIHCAMRASTCPTIVIAMLVSMVLGGLCRMLE